MFGKLFGKTSPQSGESHLYTPEETIVQTIYIREDRLAAADIPEKIRAYDAMNRSGDESTIRLSSAIDGWLVLKLPVNFHPYYFHNLAYWMVADSRPWNEAECSLLLHSSGNDQSYWLSVHPTVEPALSGITLKGKSLDVYLTNNRMFIGENYDFEAWEDIAVRLRLPNTSAISSWTDIPFSSQNPGKWGNGSYKLSRGQIESSGAPTM